MPDETRNARVGSFRMEGVKIAVAEIWPEHQKVNGFHELMLLITDQQLADIEEHVQYLVWGAFSERFKPIDQTLYNLWAKQSGRWEWRTVRLLNWIEDHWNDPDA